MIVDGKEVGILRDNGEVWYSTPELHPHSFTFFPSDETLKRGIPGFSNLKSEEEAIKEFKLWEEEKQDEMPV